MGYAKKVFRRDRSGRRFVWGLLLASACFRSMAQGQAEQLFTAQERAWISANPVVHVAVDPDWRPLEYVEDGVYKGLSAEYLKAIARVSGLEFRWKQGLGWPSARAALAERSIDLLAATSQQMAAPQSREHIAYSKPYFVGSTLIVTRASSPVMFDPRQLEGKKVAVKAGGGYERSLRLRYPAILLVAVETATEALERVASGELYAAIDVDAVLIPILQHRYFDTLHVAGSIAELPAVVSIGIRMDQPLLVSIINKSLATLTARETDHMLARWVDAASYGPPSWSELLKYYCREMLVVVLFLAIFMYLLCNAHLAQRQARRSERDKAMLLAVMSHEIRTPMNAILSSVELLGRARLAPEDAELAKIAVTSANTLLGLLDCALDFSKLEAERMVLEYRPTNIGGLIEEALSISELRAQEKGLPMKMSLQWDSPLWLSVDALRLRQVLINLLCNAIKFTEAGEVKVVAGFEIDPEDSARGLLHLSIIDTGIGISWRDQRRLFQAFTQADDSITRKFGGTGLGLTICRRLLGLMGGTIVLHSELGKGTTFVVRVPALLAEPQVHLQQTNSSASTAAAGSGMPALKVLVVEDHPQNQFVIRRQLQTMGHENVQALTGQAGLDCFAGERFDVVLLDCNLPDIDGYSVARRIRVMEAGRQIRTPIIAISAMVGAEHAESCFDAGIDGLLTKPLRVDQLREIIDLWCDRCTPAPEHPMLPEPADGDLLSAFFATCHLDFEPLPGFAQACDWPQVAHRAHRIAGAAMMLGQPRVVEAARRLEALCQEPVEIATVHMAIEHLQHALESACR